MQHLAVILAMGCAQAVIRVYGLHSGSIAIVLSLSLIMPLWLLYISCSPRSFQRSPDKQSNNIFLGQPRLLPTQVSHTRLGTGRYNYTVPHFLVGTPVGLHGRIGSVLSLDEPESRTRTAGLMQYLNPNLESWFTVHAHHHLDKGNDSIGLQRKLHHFLVSQGENPGEWPYAYLVTMPQFLGYQRNLVCFWYLYSASRELTAIIMEVNNYWGQRKIAFSRLTGEAPLHPSRISQSPREIPIGHPSAQFLHSNPRHLTYRGTWDKDMFISPFEKVEGSIALRFSDPLAPDTPLLITITLLSPSGKPRLIGRVFCADDHDPLSPLTASSWSLLRFLPYWTGVLVITELLIIAAALHIRSKGAIEFFSMPEVRPNNLSRDETDIERSLEPAFRLYLKHLVESGPSPIQLTYIPSKSHYLKPETFISPYLSTAYTDTDDRLQASHLTVQVLSPQIYTSFPLYKDAITAFESESRALTLPSDPSSRRLLVSDPGVFLKLLSSSIVLKSPPLKSRFIITKRLISYLRPPTSDPQGQDQNREGYFLDTFTEESLPPQDQKIYFASLVKHLLAVKIAFGFHPLLNLYAALGVLILQAGVSYLLFEFVWEGVRGGVVRW